VTYAGNLAFAGLLLITVVVEIRLWRRGGRRGDRQGVAEVGRPRTELRWGAGALGSILVAFAIWNATKSAWCDPDSWLQGHAVWHLLCAVSAYLMFRLWASERRPSPQAKPNLASGSTSSRSS